MTYDEIFTFDNLLQAGLKCCRGVGWKASVQNYKTNLIPHTHKIYTKLQRDIYKPAPSRQFTLSERGKVRQINSIHISERVPQKCLCDNYLIPLITRRLVYDNAACIKGKGISFSRKRFIKHLRAHYMTHGRVGYVLTFDFTKYFDSINHDILLARLSKIVPDQKIMNYITACIREHGDRGIGLGSEMSQLFALYYADPIDRLIKEQLRMKYYGRYMDDGYIIHPSKEKLKEVLALIKIKCKELGITLNTSKTFITPLCRAGGSCVGIKWLKTTYLLTESGKIIRKPCNSNIRRMKRKLLKMKKKNVPTTDVMQSVTSWKGSLKRANSYHTIRAMDKYRKELFYGSSNGNIGQWSRSHI